MPDTSDGFTTRLPAVLYGGDYNPEQWPRAIWDEDMRLMRLAHVNIASVPIFGWVSLQPNEDTFTFEWLDDILDRMAKNGVSACLATATAAQPAWLDQKYPDVLVVDENGNRRRHGNRHSFCPNSPNFRRLSTGLARRIAERYKNHPALLLWHVGNEYGTYCYCEQCASAFRNWLRVRYGSLDELNRRWVTAFWSHTFTDWAQIEPPFANGERSMQALRLDYHRFQSDSLLGCFKGEADALREVTPGVPVTTNLMGAFYPLNYRRWAQEMDVVSWDNYPRPEEPIANVAFNHALMRGLKEGQPFLLMEQSPSQQNWMPYNALKPPGALRVQSYQAIAQGADSVMYFQWRRSRGSIEKLHGAIVEHSGSPDNRVFRDVAEIGRELESLGSRTLGGRVPARVAVLFDWENWWALRFSSGPSVDLDYVKVCRAYYAALHNSGIQTDIVAPDADLSRYEVIVAPLLYLLRPEHAAQMEHRVHAGATFLTTFFSGLVDENDLVHEGGSPGPLRRLLGLSVEETDALPTAKTNGLRLTQPFGKLEADTVYASGLLCDRLRMEGAETLGVYTDDFYAGEPALTRNRAGQGQAYFLATHLEEAGLRAVLQAICAEQGIVSPLAEGAIPPPNVEVTQRKTGDAPALLYLLNHAPTAAEVTLTSGHYTDLLSGETFTETVPLPGRAVRILTVPTSA